MLGGLRVLLMSKMKISGVEILMKCLKQQKSAELPKILTINSVMYVILIRLNALSNTNRSASSMRVPPENNKKKEFSSCNLAISSVSLLSKLIIFSQFVAMAIGNTNPSFIRKPFRNYYSNVQCALTACCTTRTKELKLFF